jgi:hypothetical protein
MASTFQQQALYRKLIYAALILVLWFVAYQWRNADFSLFGMEVKGVDKQANDLAIREQSRGDVDLLGTIVRISTMGSRGLASCVLWVHAMDAQKKNEWNKLELNVRTLTKLQKHYITPWLFQSWNLSYNVSVESDRVNDKYFFISRGIVLLAEGERQNHDNPDIRWSLGFFMQHKIGQSDETNTLRSLSQLSMIPPNKRDPGRFWIVSEGRQKRLNLKTLEDFCKEHPQLVRRLREGMSRERRSDMVRQFHVERAEELVQFLADNFRVPSWWEDRLPSEPGMWRDQQDPQRPLADRFPALPPRHDPKPNQQPRDERALTNESELRDEDDAHQIALAWYAYAQEPLPKPERLPGSNELVVNPVYQRIPKHMTTLLFRDYPAQAQRFTAERMQEEGWYDDTGWEIPDWFSEQRDLFANGDRAIVGKDRKWARDAWLRALELWGAFGEANHLKISEQDYTSHEQRANSLAVKYGIQESAPPPPLREDTLDAETRDEYFSYVFLQLYSRFRTLSNFPYHYNHAVVESRDDTIRVRKNIFDANALRMKNLQNAALTKFMDAESGLKAWRQVMLSNKEFQHESLTQEQAFENQLKFVDLYSRLGGRTFKAQAAGMLLVPSLNPPGGGMCPIGLYTWMPSLIRENWDNPLLGGPFDVYDENGDPLIMPMARDHILKRLFPALYNTEPVRPGTGSPAMMPPKPR